jgi:hypothetical protein
MVPGPGEAFSVVTRHEIATTMAIVPDHDEVYLLIHGVGERADARVERIDPATLETLDRSAPLPGGRIWPGGIAAHRNGDLYVAFGAHVHRLRRDCTLVRSVELGVDAPHNSTVICDSGHLVVKDFGGRLPSGWTGDGTCTLTVLDEDLEVTSSVTVDEGSIARLSCAGQLVALVGTEHLITFEVDHEGQLHERRRTRYRTEAGQGYGWDPVLVGTVAFFLDDGEGSEAFDGSFTGKGTATAPLRLHAVDLLSGAASSAEVCGLPCGLIANPPIVDVDRHIAVGYDSSNGVVSAFDALGHQIGPLRWQRLQHHGSHLVLLADVGQLITFDFAAGASSEDLVVLDVETGHELARVATGSPIQSVLFPAPFAPRSIFACSLTTIARVAVT